MNKSQIIALFDQDQRREVTYPGMRREVTPEVVRHIHVSGSGDGMIIFSQIDENNADEIIREQVTFFESIGQDFEWKVYSYDRPPDLKNRLESHGFVTEDSETLVVLDLEEAPVSLWEPIRPGIRRIHSVEKLKDVQCVEEQVWEEDFSWVEDYLGTALKDYPEQMSVYVAYIGDQPASAAWIYFPEQSQFGSLWGGATLKDFRRQGLFTALLAVRAQEAKARRVRFLCVDASEMSRPILEKFGFKAIALTYPCQWRSGRQR